MDRIRGLLTVLAAGLLLVPAGAHGQAQADVPSATNLEVTTPVLMPEIATTGLFAPSRSAEELATAPASSLPAPLPQARNRSGVPLMIAGGVLFVTGAIIGGDAGTLLMVGGAAGGAYGAYVYFGG